MPLIALRPRSATEIVDASLQLLRASYGSLVTLSAVILSPYLLMRAALPLRRQTPYELMQHPATLALTLGVQLVCFSLAEAAIVSAVSEDYLGDAVRPSTALGRALRRGGIILVASLLRFVMVGVGLAIPLVLALLGASALGGPGGVLAIFIALALLALPVYVGARTFAITPAVMLEERGGVDAIGRSFALSGGQVGRVLVTLLIMWLVYLVAVLLFTVVGMAFRRFVPPTFVQVVGIMFIFPFLGVVTTLLYYDLRVRKEGLDLELMARDLGVGASPAG